MQEFDAWRLRAACRGMDPDLFFPGRGEITDSPITARMPKRVCAQCPVSGECLDYALHHEAGHFGIWGGTTDAEREVLRRRFGRVP